MRSITIGRWVRALAAKHARTPAQREEFRTLPLWLRRALLVSCVVDVAALTRLEPREIPGVAVLICIYGLVMLMPPVASPRGYIRVPNITFVVMLCLVWSPLHAFVAAAFGTFLAVFGVRLYDPWRAAFNSVLWAYPAALASFVGHMVFRAIPDPLVGLTFASIATLCAYLSVNFAGLPLYRHLRYGDRFWAMWWGRVKENPLAEVLAAPMPILLAAVAYGLGHRWWLDLILTGLAAVPARLFALPRGPVRLCYSEPSRAIAG